MRIVSWNCNGAFRRKFNLLDELNPDICIIQECENPLLSTSNDYQNWSRKHLWVGNNKNRGLGVFSRSKVDIRPIQLDAGPLELFLPCELDGGIRLLAAWTRHANSPTFAYIGQLWKWLQLHRSALISPALVIGDLNSNARWDIWDRWWNHSDVLKQLHELGLSSAYHHDTQEAQGEEQTQTFFMHRKIEKGYHIDYAFVPDDLLDTTRIEIGRPSDWLEHSDHMPLILDLHSAGQ